ncbi:hypothetical protein [Rubellimicrobium roseum]|uniref:hypothetical protein n=1 Tax=Rubellimicrobium roseum TaxID=687525 RepID=UPI00159BD7E8|nr:hypothetical protein [Rubellimicrobium roseum]
MTCDYGASHTPALVTLPLGGAPLIAFLIFTVQGAAITDAVAGRRLGVRPIAPALSPRS